MIKIFSLIFVLLFAYSSVFAATYTLPADISSNPFRCNGSGPDYTCNGTMSLSEDTTIILTSDVTLNITGHFRAGEDFTVQANGFALNINASQDVIISSKANFTGNITAGDDISIGEDSSIVGNLTAADNLTLDQDTTVDGICSPTHPQCTGGILPPSAGCETFSDKFNSVSYSNQDGTVYWLGNWIESNDNNSPSGGEIQITGNELRIENSNRAIARNADLSAYSSATITFDYQESRFDNNSDYIDIEVQGGGNGWTSLQNFAGSNVGSGNASLIVSSSFLASDFQIRFITSINLGGSDRFYVDNLSIEACGNAISATAAIDYHFDEAGWSGVAEEVVDSSTNVNHASISSGSGLNTISSGQVCRAGRFDGGNDYILSNDIFSLLRTTASLSFWIKTNQTGNDTGWRAPGIAGSEESGGTSDVFWGWLDASGRIGISKGDSFASKSTISINDGNYHHIVLSRNSPTGDFKIYIDGALNNSGVTGSGDVSTSFTSIGRIEDTGGTPEYFQGDLDEFIIFDRVLSDADVTGIYTNQLAGNNWDGSSRVCSASGLDHFNIDVGGGAANTCTPYSFTITAADSGNNTLTDYSGSVTISTSTSHGDFATVVAVNATVPDPDNDDNGSVGYTFDTTDNGVISLSISNSHVESLIISVNDAAKSVTSSSAPDVISFSEVGFTITDNDVNVAGDNVPVAGRNHDFRIQLIRLDPVTGCGVATGYNGSKNLKIWRTRNESPPTTTSAPTLDGNVLPAAEPVASNATINFISGVADVQLGSSDIGRFNIEVKDDSSLFVAADIAGTSVEQIVRPFGIGIDFGINLRDADFANGGLNGSNADISFALANDITGDDGSVFTQAGENFSVTISAVLWQASDDSNVMNGDGVPDTGSYLGDNTPAPSFGQEGETVTVSASNPVPGSLGSLSGNLFNSFAGGSQSQNMTYSNVGILDMSAELSDGNYWGSGVNLTGIALNVGRFNPHHYTVTSSLVNDACVPGFFTYAGQPFTAQVILEAQNKLGNRVDSFTGVYATLDVSSELTILNSETMASYDSETYSVTETFSAGTAGSAQFDVELSWDMGLQVETVTLVNLIDSSDEVTLISSSPYMLGSTEVRFGRLVLDNVFGSELVPLSMPMKVEYFDGSNFLLNSADNCTVINDADLTVTSALSGGISTVTVNSPTAVNGVLNIDLTPPGAGNTGDILISPDLNVSLDAWLQFNWDGIAGDEDPSATATFGIYEGDSKQIFYRQIYQQ